MRTIAKLLGALIALVVLVAAGAIGAIFYKAAVPPRLVGFQQVAVADAKDKPLEVSIWYPTDTAPGRALVGLSAQRVAANGSVAGTKLPLVVISHGNGGMSTSHSDTALALAAAGFVVAAPTHTGDNARDDSYVGTPRWLADRARHVRVVIDYMLRDWPAHERLDPQRIGAFGFSAGATTVLIAIGGEPDLGRIASHCAAHPELACTLWKTPPASIGTTAWEHDPRIKAAVVAAPGLGFAFQPDGLARIAAPVQLWTADDDRNVPYETNGAVVRKLLPLPPEYHAVEHAGHFAFLAPCPGWLLPAVCSDGDGFDRNVFHRELNRAVVEFFRSHP